MIGCDAAVSSNALPEGTVPSRLPIPVDKILAAISDPVCPSCAGMGRWRQKQRCRTCNGKGTTANIIERCTVCQGRGQLPAELIRRTTECSLCEGYGVVYEACRDCRQTGCLEGTDEYCEQCSGSGEVSFAQRVVDEGSLPYLEHILQRLVEYARQPTQEGLLKACHLDILLLDVCKSVNELDRSHAEQKLPASFRVAFGNARVTLKRQMQAFEERAANESVALRATILQEMHRLRSEAHEAREAIQGRFWTGLGHW